MKEGQRVLLFWFICIPLMAVAVFGSGSYNSLDYAVGLSNSLAIFFGSEIIAGAIENNKEED